MESGGEILRLQCRRCHSTHSVLTADILPYSSYCQNESKLGIPKIPHIICACHCVHFILRVDLKGD